MTAATERFRIERLAFGGEALGRDNRGRVVFVRGGVPGDLVEVEITEEKTTFARGKLQLVREPSADRVEPRCTVVDRCGGCPWQMVSTQAQLAAKQAIVAHALRKLEVEVKPIVTAPAQFGYRTRARLQHRLGKLGFVAHHSHEIVEASCSVLDPQLDDTLARVRGALAGLLEDEASVAAQVSPRGQIHLSVSLDTDHPSLDAVLATSLKLPVVGIEVHTRSSRAKRFLGSENLNVAEPGEPPFLSSSSGFAQANHLQNNTLRQLVRAAASEPFESVLELYAGDGNFSRDLARLHARGHAIESDSAAIDRLNSNLRAWAPAADWRIERASAEAAVSRLKRARAKVDLVVLDPPRQGAGDVISDLGRLSPRRIVYISCDPMTFARDALDLCKVGYRLESTQPVEMMPHTSHIELVSIFDRVGNR